MNLSSLMPSADRLEAMAAAIVARVGVARRARLSDAMPGQLLRWARPALAFAAGLALCAWFAGPSAAESSEPATALSEWALGNELPSASSFVETVEDSEQAR